MRYVRFNSNEPFWRNWLILDFEVPSELMFTQIVFWLLLLFEGYGEVAWHTLDLMYWNGHFFLTHSTQYPVQEITNLEATAEVKIRYTDHLADGPWWLQAVCTCPSKRLVGMENSLLDWFSGIKLNPYPTGKSRVRAVEVVMWHIGKGKSTLAWLD